MAAMMVQTEAEVGTDTPVLIFSNQTPTDAQLNPIGDLLMKMQKQYTDAIDYRALIFQNVVIGWACMFNRALAKLACRCKGVSQIIMLSEDDARFLKAFGKEKSGLRFYIDHKNLVHGMLRLAGFAWLG